MRLFRLLLPAVGLLCACTEEDTGDPPPRGELYYPTSLALAESGGRELLLAASSNFDLRYRAGVLHVFDREAIDALIDGGAPAEGEIVRLDPFPAETLVAALEIPSLSGELAVGPLGDGLRAIVPSRTEQSVVAVDYAGGVLACAAGGGDDCRGQGVPFPREDPFQAVIAGGNVYVGHVGRDFDRQDVGIVGAAFLDSPIWRDRGAMAEIRLGDNAVGGLAVGDCREEGGAETCTLFVGGRTREADTNPVFLFDFRPGELRSGPVFSRNVFRQQRGFDCRGVAVSGTGDTMYMASQGPAALATIDVTRIDSAAADGCVLTEGRTTCDDEPLPLLGEAEPRFVTAGLSPLPPGPNAIVALPRADGSELLVVTTSETLVFFDPRVDGIAAALDVGSAPAAVAFREAGDGFRLYVAAFGSGRLAVVDLPDPFRPATAALVGLVGRSQPGGF